MKLELTHSCNLRCGFCYTDSPRHTLARTADLEDDAWRRIADEALELGIIEAVVTGGEPLMRRELALEVMERLDAAGVGITLSTNGWFVDDALADRLARLRGVTVQISIDGASAAVHDRARGLPGSWRRAVLAVDRLLARGVRVHVAHVVTPDNRAGLDDFLEAMWTLGVPRLRLSPVIQLGAAGRSGRWHVSRRSIETVARDFEKRHGGRVPVQVLNPDATVAGLPGKAPASLLVRPDGAARMESANPFAFGNASRDGLAACWEQMVVGWSDPRIAGWAGGLGETTELHTGALLPYRDPDVDLMGGGGPPAPPEEAPRLPVPADPGPADPAADRDLVRELGFARRYRLGPVRHATDGFGARIVRVTDARRVVRINRTAALVMDACDDGDAGAAVARLAAVHPSVPLARLEQDALAGVHDLLVRGILRPVLRPGAPPPAGADAPTGVLETL